MHDTQRGNCWLQTIYLIRHGEGFHNIGWEMNLDAHLTPNGWKQAAALKEHLRKLEPQLGIQVRPHLKIGIHIQ